MYGPRKYFSGLSTVKQKQRRREIAIFGRMSYKNPAAYTGFATDKGIKTIKSTYTNQFFKLAPGAKSLKQKAEATQVPLKYIRACYNRGMAAWRTGHRPGATQQQWRYARVHSFLTCGKTYRTTDADLVEKAMKTPAAKRWWASTCKQMGKIKKAEV